MFFLVESEINEMNVDELEEADWTNCFRDRFNFSPIPYFLRGNELLHFLQVALIV